MKEISLTRGKVAIVDDEDFEKVNQCKWYAQRNKNGTQWYAERGVARPDGRWGHQSMHRLIMGLEYGDPREVDHRDRDGLNNRRKNLRVTFNQNNQNVGMRRDNTSGAKGIRQRNNRWDARINVHGESIYLGCFLTKGLAIAAYDAAVLTHHREYGVTNTMLGLHEG